MSTESAASAAYHRLEAQLVVGRATGTLDAAGEALLAEMDVWWDRMTEEERDKERALAAADLQGPETL